MHEIATVSPMQSAGYYLVEHWRNGEMLSTEIVPEHNIVPNEGINHILNVLANAATQVTAWYIGLFEGNYTPVATDTMATFPTNATESTAYTEATRQAWTTASSTAQSLTNSASKATFTINATKTIYGAFVSSVSTKSATTGTLLSASKFSSAKPVVSGDQLIVTYVLNQTSA